MARNSSITLRLGPKKLSLSCYRCMPVHFSNSVQSPNPEYNSIALQVCEFRHQNGNANYVLWRQKLSRGKWLRQPLFILDTDTGPFSHLEWNSLPLAPTFRLTEICFKMRVSLKLQSKCTCLLSTARSGASIAVRITCNNNLKRLWVGLKSAKRWLWPVDSTWCTKHQLETLNYWLLLCWHVWIIALYRINQ